MFLLGISIVVVAIVRLSGASAGAVYPASETFKPVQRENLCLSSGGIDVKGHSRPGWQSHEQGPWF